MTDIRPEGATRARGKETGPLCLRPSLIQSVKENNGKSQTICNMHLLKGIKELSSSGIAGPKSKRRIQVCVIREGNIY